MNVLSLFSGIGGMEIAAERHGFKTVAFCEIEPYAQQILKKRFPGVKIYDDVRSITAERLRRDGMPRIHMLTAGFPCQPHSLAGKRLASDDDRDLWGECNRLLCDIRCRWAIFENVPGLYSSESGRFFRRILRDISQAGYNAVWTMHGVADVGGPHQRNRVFIVCKAMDDPAVRTMRNDGQDIGTTA